jgi:hypothetical protein
MSNEERDGTVGEVIDKRVAVYGNPVETFARIAEVWSGILGVPVNATDVPLCLIGMKLVRTQVTPDYSDNSDDVEGYLDIFRKLVGEDMVHARTVTEYLAKLEEPVAYVPAEQLEVPEQRKFIREYSYVHKNGFVDGSDRVCHWIPDTQEWAFQYPGTGQLTSCYLEHE